MYASRSLFSISISLRKSVNVIPDTLSRPSDDHEGEPKWTKMSKSGPLGFLTAPPPPNRKQIGRQVEGFSLFGCAAAGGSGIQYK